MNSRQTESWTHLECRSSVLGQLRNPDVRLPLLHICQQCCQFCLQLCGPLVHLEVQQGETQRASLILNNKSQT